MTHRFVLAGAVLLAATSASIAQHHQPYSGLQSRAIKALSDEQVADLRAGRGMSLALPAELNGYPGPLHVLEHADALGLSAEQRSRMQQLFQSMKNEAVKIGAKIIAQETELDRQFAGRTITASTLTEATDAIGRSQAALRATHLRYHLLTRELLTEDQNRRYAELRGYAGPTNGTHQSPGHLQHHHR